MFERVAANVPSLNSFFARARREISGVLYSQSALARLNSHSRVNCPFYGEYANISEHDSLHECLEKLGQPRVAAVSTRGKVPYHEYCFAEGEAILFGPETRGLPARYLDILPPSQILRIPMQPDSRSLNLSNAAAVVLYEAWRQQGFRGGVLQCSD